MTDRDSDNPNNIILFYTHESVVGTWDGGNTWNREHVWCQSYGCPESSHQGSDLHQIRPADYSQNSSRGNTPYGDIANTVANEKHDSDTGILFGYANSQYFEPLDDMKGDVARILFYLIMHYEDEIEQTGHDIDDVAQSMEMLLAWNDLDPVDDYEIQRNTEVFEIQGNYNPFIDNPDYADMIWG